MSREAGRTGSLGGVPAGGGGRGAWRQYTRMHGAHMYSDDATQAVAALRLRMRTNTRRVIIRAIIRFIFGLRKGGKG